ncbi:hypothetical protein JYU29_17805 [Tianweitania sp. BSSL-BM11]|uniref:Transcriptional regulator n=1 Tax=Tianweitania aestuarii TaxID=2814886 RepID=A0ABS5RZS3_9HYPH|nr:hypothetical protein [Tianweitania aestuarii]MBS9722553.1 hypothetical protein [Tianweitania aestuarii]
MADFVAVLKKTIEGLSENTPDVRAKVYAKARATIDAKLAAINPPPPAAVAERQRQAIEDAIQAVEQYYAPPPPEDDLDELDTLFDTYQADDDQFPEPAFEREEPAALPRTGDFAVSHDTQRDDVPAHEVEAPTHDAEAPRDHVDHNEPVLDDIDRDRDLDRDLDGDLDRDREQDRPFTPQPPYRNKPRRGLSGGLIAAVVALLLVAGGAYAAWSNKDALTAFLGLNDAGDVNEGTDLADDAAANSENADSAAVAPADGVEPEAADDQPEVAAVSPNQPEQAAATPAATAPEPLRKYTQRLQADGSETDPGPADGSAAIGEGTSVAELSQAAQADTTTGEGATPAPDATPATTPNGSTPASSDQTVPVGQRAIFYEERTSTSPNTAESGSIVWSLVQESPGGDAPPEPAIRAEANIPGKNLQLRMTIRRNADPTLPASHIMEMIFLTPEGFEGGGIQNVVRVAMKDSEQATGSPLLGIPARIADGFFLVALSDSPAEIQANMTLLRRQDWIDVPLIYNSGRRALITMEKGVPGERVFEEAMQAWQNAASR